LERQRSAETEVWTRLDIEETPPLERQRPGETEIWRGETSRRHGLGETETCRDGGLDK